MKSFIEFRKMKPSEYEKDIYWLANRLMCIWKMCDIDPVRYSSLRLFEEEEYLRSIEGLDTLSFSQHMDAGYDKENHRWKDNYFDLKEGA